MPDANHELLTTLLSRVSRSFYLTLRRLPARVRTQISLAYLLARTSDTIADAEIVSPDQRLAVMGRFRDAIAGHHEVNLELSDLVQGQADAAERELLERSGQTLSMLTALQPTDLKLVQELLGIIISGQEQDLRRFASASSSQIVPLESEDDLDDYTYRVAGCVGEFWTKLCRRHLFPEAVLDDDEFLRKSVRFGKGLQLVNILRDLPQDLRQGRCYIPRNSLASAPLVPTDLLDPGAMPRFRTLYDRTIATAEAHLEVGWEYTQSVPYSQFRVRIACALPIQIGLRTLHLLRSGNVLDPGERLKVSRQEVRSILRRTLLACPFRPAWRTLPGRARMEP